MKAKPDLKWRSSKRDGVSVGVYMFGDKPVRGYAMRVNHVSGDMKVLARVGSERQLRYLIDIVEKLMSEGHEEVLFGPESWEFLQIAVEQAECDYRSVIRRVKALEKEKLEA